MSSLKDNITGKYLISVASSFVPDRFNQKNSALVVFGQSLELPDSVELPTEFTLSLWLYFDTMPKSFEKMAFLKIDSSYLILCNLSSEIFFGLEQSSRLIRTAAIDPVFEWHHIVVSFSNNQVTFYIDGLKMTSYIDDSIRSFTTVNSNITVFDEIKILNRTIDPKEVRMEYSWIPKSD